MCSKYHKVHNQLRTYVTMYISSQILSDHIWYRKSLKSGEPQTLNCIDCMAKTLFLWRGYGGYGPPIPVHTPESKDISQRVKHYSFSKVPSVLFYYDNE